MTLIPFSPDTDIELMEVQKVQVSMMEVQRVQVAMIEVVSEGRTSFFQMLQDYLTLDGGRAFEVFTNIPPLDGGGAALP